MGIARRGSVPKLVDLGGKWHPLEKNSTLTSGFQCEFLTFSWWFGISDCENTTTKAIVKWNHHFLSIQIQLMPYFPPNFPLSQSFLGQKFPLWHPSKIAILGHWLEGSRYLLQFADESWLSEFWPCMQFLPFRVNDLIMNRAKILIANFQLQYLL